MVFYPATFLLLLLTFVVQEFMPGIPMAQHATLFLPPVFFFAAAVAVPYPVMLFLAFITGFVWDARYQPVLSGKVKPVADALMGGPLGNPEVAQAAGGLAFGLSILLFGLLGTFMQGVRPLFKRGRLELPVLLVGFTTFSWLLIEYLVITFFRGSFHFPTAVWSKMITDTLLAMLASPLIFLLLYSLAGLSHYEIRYEGLKFSYDGR
jgi:cell shape-determining protein MreD